MQGRRCWGWLSVSNQDPPVGLSQGPAQGRGKKGEQFSNPAAQLREIRLGFRTPGAEPAGQADSHPVLQHVRRHKDLLGSGVPISCPRSPRCLPSPLGWMRPAGRGWSSRAIPTFPLPPPPQLSWFSPQRPRPNRPFLESKASESRVAQPPPPSQLGSFSCKAEGPRGWRAVDRDLRGDSCTRLPALPEPKARCLPSSGQQGVAPPV